MNKWQGLWGYFRSRPAVSAQKAPRPVPGKKEIRLDIAADQFLAHCKDEGAWLAAAVSSALESYCDGKAGRPTPPDFLSRPLNSSQEGRLPSIPRTLFTAHCYAVALSKGLQTIYDGSFPFFQARDLDRKVARSIAAEEVGAEHVGHAPNPFPEAGGHISYPPDTLVGGVPSQQLMLVHRYRRRWSEENALAMFCLAFRLVPAGQGIGIGVFEEIPGSRHEKSGAFNPVGYRTPEADEIDERFSDIEIIDPDSVLAPLRTEVRIAMLVAVGGVDPFWPSFRERYALAQGYGVE